MPPHHDLSLLGGYILGFWLLRLRISLPNRGLRPFCLYVRSQIKPSFPFQLTSRPPGTEFPHLRSEGFLPFQIYKSVD